jgi:predicted dithiol-disulfide oxidoreductase (DUF899 family)
MTKHRIGTHEEWQAAREELLKEEKELTRNDEFARKRRELPWVPVETDYSFETETGRSLAELFDGRSQLLIYHFMFGPVYEAGSTACSSIADIIDPNAVHLAARDVGFAHMEEELRLFLEGEIPPGVKHMAEASGTDVAGYVAEAPGLSAYALSDGVVYRTYVTTARGLEPMTGYYPLLDRTPMGRNEDESGFFWLRRHDEY